MSALPAAIAAGVGGIAAWKAARDVLNLLATMFGHGHHKKRRGRRWS